MRSVTVIAHQPHPSHHNTRRKFLLDRLTYSADRERSYDRDCMRRLDPLPASESYGARCRSSVPARVDWRRIAASGSLTAMLHAFPRRARFTSFIIVCCLPSTTTSPFCALAKYSRSTRQNTLNIRSIAQAEPLRLWTIVARASTFACTPSFALPTRRRLVSTKTG